MILKELLSGIRTIRPIDLLWILGLPVYIIIGSFRHEASHAVMIFLQGGEVVKFVIPTFLNGMYYGGYIYWNNVVNKPPIYAAPYVDDLLFVILALIIVWSSKSVRKNRALLLNIAVLGPMSSFINSFYNYAKALSPQSATAVQSDVYKLMGVLPAISIHPFFIIALSFYIFAFLYLLTKFDGADTGNGVNLP